MQTNSLFTEDNQPDLNSQIIAKRQDFDKLFEGFHSLKAISYVTSPTVLLEYIEKKGFNQVELVVGDSISEPSLKESLKGQSIETIEKLEEHISNGLIKILVPKRTIHTKLYILSNENITRVIQTSANFTETGTSGYQINYAWYADYPNSSSKLQKIHYDYNQHLSIAGCQPFMGDLIELLKKQEDSTKEVIIRGWLEGNSNPVEAETVYLVQNLTTESITQAFTGDNTSIITMQMPSEKVKEALGKRLKPVGATISSNTLSVNTATYLNSIQQNYGVPPLTYNSDNTRVLLWMDGKAQELSSPWPSPQQVNQGLEHIEKYINMTELGTTIRPEAVKASIFEAMLYCFYSPFASRYFDKKRETYSFQIDSKGPRMLYIYGNTNNGKTTFLKFMLKLMTGKNIDPLSRDQFKVQPIKAITEVGTLFPLMFDDVSFPKKDTFEKILKSYWEIWYQPNYLFPQIIITTNEEKLQDWAQTRTKRVDFDIAYNSDNKSKRLLKELFEQNNDIFKWFSYHYLELLKDPSIEFQDDELYLARRTMTDLYQYANRSIPEFFLSNPVEKNFDVWKEAWKDNLYTRKIIRIENHDNRKIYTFPADMTPYEVMKYKGGLPPNIKAHCQGNSIIIESPKEFDQWCPKPKNFWQKMFKK